MKESNRSLDFAKCLNEVERKLKFQAKSYPRVVETTYNSNYSHIAAIPIPIQRDIHKQGYSFSNLSQNEQFKVWNYIWKNTKYFEVMNQPHFFLEIYSKDLDPSLWNKIKSWSVRVDNWAHGDWLCSFYASLNELYPEKTIPILKKWNSSSKPWLRRLSIISLFYYSSMRKKRQVSFNLALSMVKPLLLDDHFYVQKAFGWTLREMYNVYPDKTYSYLKKIAHDIPPAGWQAATEKLTKKDKNLLKKLRKISK